MFPGAEIWACDSHILLHVLTFHESALHLFLQHLLRLKMDGNRLFTCGDPSFAPPVYWDTFQL